MFYFYFCIIFFSQIFSAYPSTEEDTKPFKFNIDYMLKLVNNARAAKNVAPLKLNPILITAAQLHSEDQDKMKLMSHIGSDNSTFSIRLERLGFDFEYAAENVAWNQKTEDEVMEAWIKSPGHYKNIMNPEYTLFGAAVEDFYWTQEFGTLFG